MRFFHHRTTCLLLIILTHSSALGASSSEQVAPVLGEGTTLSFNEAWSRLADENASIRSSEEMVSKAKNERNAARSLYLPSVSIEGSYTRIDDPIVIDLDPIRQTILKLHHLPSSTVPPFVEQVQDEEFGKVTLQGTWTLFTGGKRPAANQAASARLKDAEAQAETTLAETRSALVSRYFGLRLAREVVRVRRELEDAMARHAEEARKIEKAGLIAKAERLHAEVALADARMEARSAESDVLSAQAALRSLLPSPGEVEPTSGLFMTTLSTGLGELQQAVLENQPALRRVDANLSLAQAGARAQKGRFLPDIYVYGKDELYRRDLTLLEPQWAVGVGARLPLFEGGKRVFDHAAARHQVESVEALREQARRDLVSLVEVRYRSLHKAEERFKALEATVELARENERVRAKAFESGMATSLEVTDAQAMLAKARLGRLAAAYDFDVALALLLETVGLSEDFEKYREAGTEVKP